MKIYFPIAKVDAERREVWGYASTEARDDQGEIVKRDALVAALGDYMKFANIREMHQLSAVGVAKEAAVDDRGLYLGAKIVDDQAWQKVVEGVYKGYSIGGRVTQRDPADFKIITGLVLNEISLVDRPANPEAIFDYWKAGGISRMPQARFNPPLQVWTCGVSGHRHLAKSDAMRCQENMASGFDLAGADGALISGVENRLEKTQTETEAAYGDVAYADPGYQADGKKRYPVDTETHTRAAWNFINRPSNARRYTSAQLGDVKSRIIAAWKEKIDGHGPPSAEAAQKADRSPARSALTKALWDVGHVVRIILDLNWLRELLAIEAAMEGDNSPQPSKLQAIIAELCSFLNALVAEETSEIVNDSDVGGAPEPRAAEIMIMAAGASGANLLADLCRGPKMQKLAAEILAKARHSDGDQALLDLAYDAIDKCIGMNGLLFAEKTHIAKARDALLAAGAAARKDRMGDNMDLQLAVKPLSEPNSPESPTHDTKLSFPGLGSRVLEVLVAALDKRGAGHQVLMDIAHDCIGKLTDGMCCVASKEGARHSQETLGQLTVAHDHLVVAGAKCDATGFGPESQWSGTAMETTKVLTGDLTKALAEERAEKAGLIATLADIVPRLDQLTKRVEEIARTPLPPLAIARNITAISKQQDIGGSGLSSEDLVTAFSQMSREEQTLTLIKASHARPIHAPSLATAKNIRNE